MTCGGRYEAPFIGSWRTTSRSRWRLDARAKVFSRPWPPMAEQPNSDVSVLSGDRYLLSGDIGSLSLHCRLSSTARRSIGVEKLDGLGGISLNGSIGRVFLSKI